MVWVGTSLEDLTSFPDDVKDEMGYGIYLAQLGEKHRRAKPLKGLGGGVLEMIASPRARCRGGTWRDFMSARIKAKRGSGNVFADLGRPRPDEALAKARLAYEIERCIRDRGLTQAEAAKLLDVDQPKISALLNGRLRGFSVERLIRFLNAMSLDVEIVVSPEPRSRRRGRLQVRAA